MKNSQKTVAKINDISVIIFEEGDTLVPIKPICEALGVSSHKQAEKIKNDEILSSTATLRVAVGKDGKIY